jgi:hypothetical protein
VDCNAVERFNRPAPSSGKPPPELGVIRRDRLTLSGLKDHMADASNEGSQTESVADKR